MAGSPPSDNALPLLRAAHLLGGAQAWQALLDMQDCGVVVYDANGCLVTCNEDFRRQYAPIAEQMVPGASFEQLLRLALAHGLVPQAAGQEASWLESRLRDFGHASAPIERQMADGRWRRVSETRLSDGGVLYFSIDITELVDKRAALQSALQQARLASERLEDALEALPAGFELWDADDRLVLSNSELARMYPKIAAVLKPGVSFEQLVRANHAAGALADHGRSEHAAVQEDSRPDRTVDVHLVVAPAPGLDLDLEKHRRKGDWYGRRCEHDLAEEID